MLKIDEKIHWNLSNSSLIVYQDTWHYTSQWPSRQRQRQQQQEGWWSAPPLSPGQVFFRFARFFPQISWHLVIFITDPLIEHIFTNLIIFSPIPVVETLQCLTLHLFVDWKQFFVWSPGKIKNYQFSSTVPKQWFGEVQCDLFYHEKAFFWDINFQGFRRCVFVSLILWKFISILY